MIQYIGIDCLVYLLRDEETRYKVVEIAAISLADLAELKKLGNRFNVEKTITKSLLLDYENTKLRIKNKKVLQILQELWDFQLQIKRQKLVISAEEVQDRRVLIGLIKQQGNHLFLSGEIQEALNKYNEALKLCPLRLRKERMALYSNRAQCYLVLGGPDGAISDSTKALCLSSPVNSNAKSLWRRSQAYDMKGLAKESLMDCVMFLNCCVNGESGKRGKVPYCAARMISKQMDATWIFADVKLKSMQQDLEGKFDGYMHKYEELVEHIMTQTKGLISAGLGQRNEKWEKKMKHMDKLDKC